MNNLIQQLKEWTSGITYRLRSHYEEAPEHSDRVFASTTDSEQDSMNNMVGVTAHCECGHVFCDDVVYGKTQPHAPEESPQIVECEITREISKTCGRFVIIKPNQQRLLLSEVCNSPDFVGFKFESGQVEFSPIVFKSSDSTKSICQFRDLVDLEVLHATHVLFRRSK